MFKYNLTIFLRNIKRDKSSFFINLIGLSTGLACALLIYLWVDDELNIDKFHEKDSQLYQVMQNYQMPDGIHTWEYTPALLANSIIKDMPEIEMAVSSNNKYFTTNGILSNGERAFETNGLYVSEDYLKIFDYKVLCGNKEQMLTDKKYVVISEKYAQKLFKSIENIIGKTIEWEGGIYNGVFEISGVFKNMPSNSSVKFDILFHFDLIRDNISWVNNWKGDGAITYVVLKKGTNIADLNKKLTHFIKTTASRKEASLFLQKYSERYLNSKYENGVITGGRIEYVRLFSIIALFILLIACINFINLSTAKADLKLKEIGIKKTMGSGRKMLIFQFLGESILISTFSLIIAIILVIILLPIFNEITGKSLQFIIGTKLLFNLIMINLLTGLVSGSYPAIYLSGLNPIKVLKAGNTKSNFNKLWLRKGLVIFQFSISVVFITGFIVVTKQIKYTQTKTLGYNRDNIICFDRKGEGVNNEVFLAEIKKIPGVLLASNMTGPFLNNPYTNNNYSWKGKTSEQQIPFPNQSVGYGFFETLDMQFVEGRPFSDDYKNEYSKVIVNEAAVEFMGFKEPLGEIIQYGQNQNMQIIGIVKDFQINSLHENIKPCFIRFEPNGRNIIVKVKGGTEISTLEKLENLYKKFHPKYPFDFTFLDLEYQALYDSENRVAFLSKYFAFIAIIISCMGVFGLGAFTIQQRKKEIGIRKVQGSTTFGIVRLLFGDLTTLIFFSILISMPLGYYISKNWLNSFAYRIELNWWIFAGAGIIALLIGWLTVAMQTFKAANSNPVICLKDE